MGRWWILGAMVLVACDKEAPPEPSVGPVPSPTSLDHAMLSGGAEPGAKITISGGMENVTTTADAFSAGWWAEVALTPDSENVLSVTATDEKGNKSKATEVVVVHESPRAETLLIDVLDPIIDADGEDLVVTAIIGNDEPIDLAGFDVVFSVDGYDDVADVKVETDNSGRAVGTISGLTTAGSGTLTVSSGDASAAANFVVVGGAADTVELMLSDGTNSGTSLTVGPMTPVTAEIVVTDAQDNELASPVLVVTDAPNALVQGHVITGLSTAGTWTVAASVVGTNVLATGALTVTPGSLASVDLELDTALASVGDAVEMTVTPMDAWGNEVSQAVAVTSSDLGATFSGSRTDVMDGDTVTFGSAGTWSVTASAGGFDDTEYVQVSTVLDFEPPTVSITSPASGTELQPGSPVVITVDAADSNGLLRVGIVTTGIVTTEDVFLMPPNTTSTSETFSFVLPSNAFGQTTIFAFAEDVSGNQANAQAVTVIAQLPNNIDCPSCADIVTAAAGYDEGGIFPQGDEGGVRNPREVAVGPGGEIYVAMFTNVTLSSASGFISGTEQEEAYISVILPNGSVRAFATATDTQNIPNFQTWGMAYDDTSNTLYASVDDGIARIIAFTPNGIQDPFENRTGRRDRGLWFFEGADRLVAVHNPDIDSIFSSDPSGPTDIITGETNADDVCGDDGSTLYWTSDDTLEMCSFTAGTASTCANPQSVDTGGVLTGGLGSCVVGPSGTVYVANRTSGAIVAVGATTTEIATGFNDPVGLDIDPTTGDLIVSDAADDAVFRLVGNF